MTTVKWEGYNINTTSTQAVAETLIERSKNPGFTWVTTLNPKIILQADTDSSLKSFIRQSICITADGQGVVKVIQKAQKDTVEKVTGIDLVQTLIQKPVKVYLLGATPQAVQATVDNFQNNFKIEAQIVGSHHGYFKRDEWQYIVSDILDTKPEFIFVGMGCPRQESVLMALSNTLNEGVGIGVGGSFDILSGRLKRAPKFWQANGLEWLYRCLVEPRRFKKIGHLWTFYRRYLV